MTESTQLQTAENNNAGVVKMEPPPPATSSVSVSAAAAAHALSSLSSLSMAATGSALSPATPPPSSLNLSHHQQQQQQQQNSQHQQHYALKWNDFQSSILSSFRHLRDEEDFVDVTLACDERSFTAHKVVLSACSPYFRRLLKANPCEHPIVILRDVRCDDVENLLSFMYNGEVNVSHEQLPDFLKTAHLLQIRGLADVNGGYPYSKALSAALSHNNNNNSSSSNTSGNSSSNNNNSSSNNNNNLSESSNHNKISSYLPQNQTSGSSSNSNNNHSNNSSSNNNNSGSLNSSLNSPFSAPPIPPPVTASSAVAAAAAAASLTAAVAAAAAATASGSSGNSNSASGPIGGTSGTPAIQELKASSAASPVRNPNPNPSKASSSNHWDLGEMEGSRKSHLTPPPQKRIKSADLFRAQHGISPERLLLDREFPVAGQHPLTRNRSGRDTSKDRERNMELRESLLGQALENSNGQQANQKHDLGQSAGEDSNSSDTEPSDRGDGQHDGTLDGIDNQRSHSFPNAFLGLQGIPGLLPGPSGINSDFVSRRSLEMRVRATDPRPCPKCGKIYRSAHTLRTHLEDKHTVCPGYRCVLCGTVAKSRNSLHSHMSRQHRGISTKDLPVLPMPSAFDPELASRLLAKAGVKISPAELRARASPTGGSGSSGGGGGGGGGGQAKLDLSNASGGPLDDAEDSDEDPEDLTTGNGLYGMGGSSSDLSRYHESLLSNFGHARMRNEAAAAAATAAALGQPKDLGVQMPSSNAAGQSLLDTYLQFITENTFGMGMSQEQAAAAALRAKMAQLNAMGHNLDSLPPGLIPGQFDLSKLAGGNPAFGQSGPGLTIEPIMRHDQAAGSLSPSAHRPLALNSGGRMMGHEEMADHEGDLRREGSEPMDLGLDNNQSGSNHEVANSDAEENYSEDEGVHNT
ncbi:LOW QUALITY PROTEIN: protein abrupt [Drosophila ficusphila]|uniref:LOW QUALITY PROTEIN: protein abrupt n=1 Tax=Drosophila ficusphila TaxID=30025 RepID=UPI0007E73F1B|nr:LOW QUALITY PROTEIN: protein abrupt [Drosophila ficusphila]